MEQSRVMGSSRYGSMGLWDYGMNDGRGNAIMQALMRIHSRTTKWYCKVLVRYHNMAKVVKLVKRTHYWLEA